MYTRGYPSEFISYTLENICVKFHAFIRSVTKISLRDWTSVHALKPPPKNTGK